MSQLLTNPIQSRRDGRIKDVQARLRGPIALRGAWVAEPSAQRQVETIICFYTMLDYSRDVSQYEASPACVNLLGYDYSCPGFQ